MRKMIHRVVLGAGCALGIAGLIAGPAQAASPVTVSAATHVTPGSAVLHGRINTGGQPVSYVFEYDTLSDWKAGGDNAGFTDTMFVPAGTGTVVAASGVAGCFPFSACGPDGTPLTPGKKYVFFLQAQYGTGQQYYYQGVQTSGQGTFPTPPLGTLKLRSSRVSVTKRVASVKLRCASFLACKGKLAVTTHHRGKLITCLASRFSVRAGKSHTLKARVSGRCVALLKASSKGRLGATLRAKLTLGQRSVTRRVTLV